MLLAINNYITRLKQPNSGDSIHTSRGFMWCRKRNNASWITTCLLEQTWQDVNMHGWLWSILDQELLLLRKRLIWSSQAASSITVHTIRRSTLLWKQKTILKLLKKSVSLVVLYQDRQAHGASGHVNHDHGFSPEQAIGHLTINRGSSITRRFFSKHSRLPGRLTQWSSGCGAVPTPLSIYGPVKLQD